MLTSNKWLMPLGLSAILIVAGCTDNFDNSASVEVGEAQFASVALESVEASTAKISYFLVVEPQIGQPLTIDITVTGLNDRDYQVILEPGEGLTLGTSQEASFALPSDSADRAFSVVVTPQIEGRAYLGVSLVDDTEAGRTQFATQVPIQLGPLAPYRGPKKTKASTGSDPL